MPSLSPPLPERTPSVVQLSEVLHGSGLLDEPIDLLLHVQVLRLVRLREVSASQLGEDAVDHLDGSVREKKISGMERHGWM